MIGLGFCLGWSLRIAIHIMLTLMCLFCCNYDFHPKAASFIASVGFEVPLLRQRVRMQNAKSVWSKVHGALDSAVLSAKHKSDVHCRSHNLKVGDRGGCLPKTSNSRQPFGRLGPRFIGPFKIIRQINPVAFMLDLSRNMRISRTYCLLLYILKLCY